ncbi:condensation domain-containing protein, partial [Nocardiopsis dassonvillei]|uniref:condensation domain-containing protein n=1 Tax=Nocardiopsis dassonvillei TaxID=2014 RepID=UPI00200CE91B
MRPDLEAAFVAPRGRAEAVVARVWARVLGVEEVGVFDNFFSLGGDSIRAVRVVGALRESGFVCSVRDVMRLQTVAGLVRASGDGARGEGFSRVGAFALVGEGDRALLPEGVVDAYPMAMVQAGMVFELSADPDLNLYHNVTTYLLRGVGFDEVAFGAVAREVVSRHEVLRTSFDLTSFSVPMQLVHGSAVVQVGWSDLSGLSQEEQDRILSEFAEEQRRRPFEVQRAPLLRFHAHRTGADTWHLTVVEFHAILDGWSHNSLVTEFAECYRGLVSGGGLAERAPDPVRFADFVAEEAEALGSRESREFWWSRLDAAGRLEIPESWADPEAGVLLEEEVSFADVESGLRALARAAGASFKSVLLAAHVCVWSAVNGGRGFHSGLVSNGRLEVEGGDRVLGMFLNTLPFLAPRVSGSWRDLVSAVFDEEMEGWAHRR